MTTTVSTSTRYNSSNSTNMTTEAAREQNFRKGKWTLEEENYCNKIIFLFNHGLLPIECGTTLRTYLSDKLNCDPMRITKKYSGTSCIGKQVFQPCPYEQRRKHDMKALGDELDILEGRFLTRLGNKGKLISFSKDSRNGSRSSMSSSSNNYNRISSNQDYDDNDDDDGSNYNSNSNSNNNSNDDLTGDNFNSSIDQMQDDTPRNRKPNSHFLSIQSGTQPINKSISEPQLYGKSAYGSIIDKKYNINNNKRMRSSQSTVYFGEYEKYVVDDNAAGDLLLQFFDTMKKTHSHESLVEMNIDENEMKTSSSSPMLVQQQRVTSSSFDGSTSPIGLTMDADDDTSTAEHQSNVYRNHPTVFGITDDKQIE